MIRQTAVGGGEGAPPVGWQAVDGERGGSPARVPPEARGLARDGVRLLVGDDRGFHHARFRALGRFLRPGDLLVVNTSATLPAAVEGVRGDGRAAAVHFSTALDDRSWGVELRPAGRATGPAPDVRPGERVELPGGAALELLAPYPDPGAAGSRLWRTQPLAWDALELLRSHGRPIAYTYVEGRWPLAAYQTVFARVPGSAEMPSAGRPFSGRLVASLVAAGVGFAPVVLHAGVSSPEAGEPPFPERFAVPAVTVRRIESTWNLGGRVVAVGTTAARALETAAAAGAGLRASRGWTDLVLGAERPARIVDGLITGWHPPGASHLALLEAVAGAERTATAYREARSAGYLWHEFGDSCLLWRPRPGSS